MEITLIDKREFIFFETEEHNDSKDTLKWLWCNQYSSKYTGTFKIFIPQKAMEITIINKREQNNSFKDILENYYNESYFEMKILKSDWIFLIESSNNKEIWKNENL